MATFQYKGQGLRQVGAYQVSGHPFITGSADLDDDRVQMVEFPYVSRSFTVINTSTTGSLRVHFQSGSTAAPVAGVSYAISDDDDVIKQLHYISVPAGNGSVTMDVKCRKLYISNGSSIANLTYQVFAELTGIPKGNMYHLTGSGITE